MTTQRIVFSNPDGSIGIITPAPNARLVSRVGAEIFSPPVEAFHFFRSVEWLQEAEAMNYVEYAESENGFVARIVEKDMPEGATLKGVHDISEIPQDRTFREAWGHDDKKPVVDMGRAREIHMSRIRDARNKKLRELDNETMAAARDEAKLSKVDAKKQKLRDIPATFNLDAATTPDQLKAMWPAELS